MSHTLKFSVPFDCGAAVAFAVWLVTGGWKWIVWFALVRGVLHCFKLAMLHVCHTLNGYLICHTHVASRFRNQILHRQKQNRFILF